MTRRLPSACAALLLLVAAACRGDKPAAAPAAQQKPVAAASPAAAPAAAAPAVPEWQYTSVGKRDPFRSFLTDVAAAAKQLADSKCTTPLGRFELEQLKLVAVVTGLEDPVAMVEAPNGVGYSLHRGACIGRNGGVIAAVRTGEVVISEWVLRPDGTRERAQTLLRLPKQAVLNLEE